jgi:HEAT repeat protein
MGERFRLIYLKSTGPEKSELEESSPPRCSEEISDLVPSSSKYSTPDTLSSKAFLNQAKADLKHPDPKVKILAIQYLEQCNPSITVPLLQEILSDPDPDVRAQALHSLIKFRDPIVSPLLKKYLKDKDPRVRIAALKGLFNDKEKIDLNILIQFLSDESSWVRRKIATLLGWTQIEGVFPILVEMSKDRDPKVRKAGLFSIITLYPEEGENRLVEAMTDSDPDLRRWARVTLEKMVSRPLKRMAPLSNRV